jgi:hypothetical protein
VKVIAGLLSSRRPSEPTERIERPLPARFEFGIVRSRDGRLEFGEVDPLEKRSGGLDPLDRFARSLDDLFVIRAGESA